jgi:hypothetical protein
MHLIKYTFHLVDTPFHHTDRDRCLYTHSRQNEHGCKLVLEAAHHHIVLISQHYNFMLVGHTAPTSVPSVKTIASGAPIDNLLAEFPGWGIHRKVQQNTIHHIRKTPGPPVACSPHRLAPDCLAVAKAEFDTMLWDSTAQNIDKEPWPSALHLLPKKGNCRQLYGDYRALNTRTIPDQYPIRHTNEYAHHLSSCTIFSKIDPMRAYHQIPVHPEDIQKAVTTTPTPLGIF